MKTFLSILALALTATTAFAGERTLQGGDALDLANIIKQGAVETDNGNVVRAAAISCEARASYVDICLVYSQLQDPAEHATELFGDTASRLWMHLHQAGFVNSVSDTADGTAGEAMIGSGEIVCTLGTQTCALQDR